MRLGPPSNFRATNPSRNRPESVPLLEQSALEDLWGIGKEKQAHSHGGSFDGAVSKALERRCGWCDSRYIVTLVTSRQL
jgi:hypothetical protein